MSSRQSRLLLCTLTAVCLERIQADFVKLRKEDGKWWFIDPDGEKMLSYSVTAVVYGGAIDKKTGVDELKKFNDAKYHGNRGEWARATMDFLSDHEFNTLGPWSSFEISQIYTSVTPSGFWTLESGDEYKISGTKMTVTKGWSVGQTFTVSPAPSMSQVLIQPGWYGGGGATFTASTMTWNNGAHATRKGSIPDGWWRLESGNVYSISGTTMTLEKGWNVGHKFTLSDVTPSSFLIDDPTYGDGRATFTSESMTWGNGKVATRTERKAMFYTPIIGIGGSFCKWQLGSCFPDVFSESFKKHAVKMAQERASAMREDRWLLGWFADNELMWIIVGGKTLLKYFQSLPEDAAGRREVDKFVAEVGAESEKDLNYKWTRYLSAKYHSIVREAMREADPNHLLLGTKFISQYHTVLDPVVQGACPHLDAFSHNIYSFTPGHAYLDHYYELCDKPIVIGETGFKATENLSGNPNTRGAGPVLPTQRARAKAFEAFVRKFLSKPYAVGFNFFTWSDQPPGGRRPDGEDGNYGLISSSGGPYSQVLNTMRSVFSSATSLHEVGQVANKCHLDRLDYYGGAEGLLISSNGNLCLTAKPDATVGLDSCAAAKAETAEPAGDWVLPNGDEYSISGIIMTLTKGFGVGGTFTMSDMTSDSFTIPSDYGHGSATFTASEMTWANGITARRAAGKQAGNNNHVWQVVRLGGREGFRLKNKGTQGCLYHKLYGKDQHELLANGPCYRTDSLERFPFAQLGPPAWEHDSDCSLMQICNLKEQQTWATGVCRYESSCVSATQHGAAEAKSCETGLAQQEFAFVDLAADTGLETPIIYQ